MKRAVAAVLTVSIVALAAMAATGSAQGDYPDKPVQIIVPFPPGGNTDILTRVMADQLSTALKQPFTVASKPGAGAQHRRGVRRQQRSGRVYAADGATWGARGQRLSL